MSEENLLKVIRALAVNEENPKVLGHSLVGRGVVGDINLIVWVAGLDPGRGSGGGGGRAPFL